MVCLHQLAHPLACFFFLLSLPAVLSASLHPHLLVHNVVSFAFTPQNIRVYNLVFNGAMGTQPYPMSFHIFPNTVLNEIVYKHNTKVSAFNLRLLAAHRYIHMAWKLRKIRKPINSRAKFQAKGCSERSYCPSIRSREEGEPLNTEHKTDWSYLYTEVLSHCCHRGHPVGCLCFHFHLPRWTSRAGILRGHSVITHSELALKTLIFLQYSPSLKSSPVIFVANTCCWLL